jgi:hypothetical protein
MRTNSKKRVLLFGDLVAAIFQACGRRRAKELVRAAVNDHLVVFPGRQRVVISEE